MKKLAAVLLILTFTKMGVAYADTNEPLTIRNFFLGTTPSGDANLNQVLALLVGPQGVPGAAGVAGRDGFIGMNGQDGKDGINGAPGIIGPQGLQGFQGLLGQRGETGAPGAPGPAGVAGVSGTAVLAVVVSIGSAECNGNGGTKFVTAGATTYACNGGGGGGSGGGTTFTFGQGTVQIGTCDSDATVGFTFPTSWSGTDFFLGQVAITGVDGACIGATLKLYFKIKATGTLFIPSSGYSLGDNLVCSHPLSAAEPGLGANPETRTNNVFTITGGTSCTRTSAAGSARGSVNLGEIGSRDLSDWVGFEII